MNTRRARVPKREPFQETLPEGHLTVQSLAAYHRGQLADSAQEEIREHFLLCYECREMMLDLAEFLDEDPPPSRSSVQDVMAAWLDLERASS